MNILFALAHPDDEAFGPAGTIRKLADNNHVLVVSLCKGNRPGSFRSLESRQEAFIKSCSLLGAQSLILDSDDVGLEEDYAKDQMSRVIASFKPEVIYTHSIKDLHKDHRTLAEVMLVLARPSPNSLIKKLVSCEIPSAGFWSWGQFGGTFQPNYFIDIGNQRYIKDQVVSLYDTELYPSPDIRSKESIWDLARLRGSQSGTRFAEAFEIIYQKD